MDYRRRSDDGASPGPADGRGNHGGRRRRLAETLLAAVHQACDLGELDTARGLLALAEDVSARRGMSWELGRRRVIENLVFAHERLWQLRRSVAHAESFPVESFEFLRRQLYSPADD
ncbi:hypothetical protein J2D73_07765 [Acetobacter sacchari]|uniref:Uncharacterized protein n=1 Tax=Acetobacter sacchari TaxID=2661687 RepID=A0ABS3LUW1_9PROT|nr:hypothetical protein [Acetobacter sacchari]MBO1359690.1 hypothetical protein [Acetobacter sacchari]